MEEKKCLNDTIIPSKRGNKLIHKVVIRLNLWERFKSHAGRCSGRLWGG
jgi:hypothetical protein